MTDSDVYHFRPRPGPRERQLKRRYRNPLFGPGALRLSQAEVEQARAQDLEELGEFEAALRELVREAAELPPQADSDVVLQLKERCDRLYEQCAGLGGELGPARQAIQRLTQVIMSAVWHGAGTDPLAQAELEQEESARAQHYALLSHPLIADLLRPDAPIPPEELVPTLLSEDAVAVEAAMGLFDPDQRRQIMDQAQVLASALRAKGEWPARADSALAAMAAALARDLQ
jgi:hypothetical protein